MTSYEFQRDLILSGTSMVTVNLLTETFNVSGLNCI